MSSSDSDDDCYGNATKKLQNLINNYSEDKIDTANLLKDSSEQPVIEVNANETAVTIENVETVSKDDSLYEDDVILDQIIALNSIRQTRSKTIRGTTSKRRGRGARRGRVSKSQSKQTIDTPATNTEAVSNNFNLPMTTTTRGARTRRSLDRDRSGQRNRNMNNRQMTYPTYSVGNTEEYEDLSDNLQLFNTKPLAQEVDDPLDENEELSLKVYWCSSEIVKFTIRKFQKILQIFDFFAKRENVTTDKVLLTYNDRILKPDDTPNKIDYNIAKFIDGGIVNSAPIILDTKEEVGSGLKLKFQCQHIKKPFICCIQKDEKLLQAMVKCAEHFEKPFDVLKFVFDGDTISGSMTSEDLDLEGGECIDVKIVR